MHIIICILLIGTLCSTATSSEADNVDATTVAAVYATPATITTIVDSDLDDFDFESDAAIESAIPFRDHNDDATATEDDYANANDNGPNDANQLDSLFDDMEDVETDSFSEKEKRIKTALLKSTGDKRNTRIFTQILPILRGLSKSQRTALAALVSAQLSLEPGQELSFEQVCCYNLL